MATKRELEAAQSQIWSRTMGLEAVAHDFEGFELHSPRELIVVRLAPIKDGPYTFSFSREESPKNMFWPRMGIRHRYGQAHSWESFTLREGDLAAHAPLPDDKELSAPDATCQLAERLGEMLLYMGMKKDQELPDEVLSVELFGAGIR